MPRPVSPRIAALCGLLAAVACGGSDVPTGIEDPGGGEPVQNPSFATDVNGIFIARGCTAGNCHGGGSGTLNLSSSAPGNYANLVGVTAAGEPAFQRVEPGDAQNSYLVIKLEGRQSSGGRMPIGRPALSAAEIGTIRNWIQAGAPNN